MAEICEFTYKNCHPNAAHKGRRVLRHILLMRAHMVRPVTTANAQSGSRDVMRKQAISARPRGVVDCRVG